jgi:hypothetical protein
MKLDFCFIKYKNHFCFEIVRSIPSTLVRLLSANRTWIDRLSDEERAFLKRFVLASGSLKAIAQEYGVTYPTIRLRLDRIIEKIKIFDSTQILSEFERQLRGLHAEGRIDLATLKLLLEAHRLDQQSQPQGES